MGYISYVPKAVAFGTFSWAIQPLENKAKGLSPWLDISTHIHAKLRLAWINGNGHNMPKAEGLWQDGSTQQHAKLRLACYAEPTTQKPSYAWLLWHDSSNSWATILDKMPQPKAEGLGFIIYDPHDPTTLLRKVVCGSTEINIVARGRLLSIAIKLITAVDGDVDRVK